MHSVSGTLASVVCGLPYALAAQIAFPKRQVVAFVRDGGYSMLMGDLATAIRYRLPIKVVVVKNNYLGQIRWEQMVFLGNPETRSTCNQLISPRTPNPSAHADSASTIQRTAVAFCTKRLLRPALSWLRQSSTLTRTSHRSPQDHARASDPLRRGACPRRAG
jgi:thiamine pyrophosphate-dependent acetolactate synthase large subunit-like protein